MLGFCLGTCPCGLLTPDHWCVLEHLVRLMGRGHPIRLGKIEDGTFQRFGPSWKLPGPGSPKLNVGEARRPAVTRGPSVFTDKHSPVRHTAG